MQLRARFGMTPDSESNYALARCFVVIPNVIKEAVR